jgi:hypothetical protein
MMAAPIYPEGRPGYGEVRPKIITRKDGSTYQVYEGCYNAAPQAGGQRKYVSDADKKKALKMLHDEIKAVEAGTKARDGTIKLDAVIEEYLGEYEKKQRRGEVRMGSLRREQEALRRVPDKLRRMRIAQFEDSGLIEDELKAMLAKYAVSTVGLTKALWLACSALRSNRHKATSLGM